MKRCGLIRNLKLFLMEKKYFLERGAAHEA